MDFSLGDDRRMMADSLSRYFSDTLDWEARQAAAHSEDGFSRQMWSGLTELGVLGMLFSEEAGGYGGSAFDAGAVFSEVGKALATGPFLATLMAGKVLEAAGEADTLGEVIAGSRLLSFADEPAINADGSVVAPVRATQDFPIDVTRIVALDVRPVLRKLGARAFQRAAVAAGEAALDHVAGLQDQTVQKLELPIGE